MPRPLDSQFTAQSPWLDLVNSRMSDGFDRWTDQLHDARWVASFLKYWGTDARGLSRSSAVAQLAGLRGLLRRLTEKTALGTRLGPVDVQHLNRYLSEPSRPSVEAIGATLTVVSRPVRPGWRWVRARVALSFVEDVQRRPERIKTCGNPECRWAFVDATKGNIRRWCRDQRCGNRLRVRRARLSHSWLDGRRGASIL